jgi:hypothetical protein
MSKSKQPSGPTQIDRTSRRATPRQHGPSVTLRIIIVIRNDRVKLLIEIIARGVRRRDEIDVDRFARRDEPKKSQDQQSS